MEEKKKGRVKELYEQRSRDREPYLRRARLAALLTKPYLIPENDVPLAEQDFPDTWQNIGSKGVTSFASKLSLSLFPYQATWFQYSITNRVDKDALIQMFGAEGLQQIEYNLACREEDIRKYTETTELRALAAEWFEHAQVAGNVLACIPLTDTPMRCYGLNRYVVKRNYGGAVQEIIIKDAIRPSALPEEVRDYCNIQLDDEDKPVELYNWIHQDGKRWVMVQELEGRTFPEEGEPQSGYGAWETFPFNFCPYIPMRWRAAYGEDYGRSFIDDFFGDLYNLEVITKAIQQGAQISARMLIGIKPGAQADPMEISTAANGSVITADFLKEVTPLQIGKQMDLSVAEKLQSKLEREISLIFRMKQGIQRQGERVTATEIQELVQDINENTGSVYALFMREVQQPVIKLLSRRMELLGKLQPIPDDLFDTSIVTGLEALGRSRNLQKIQTFIQILAQNLTPELTLKYLNAPVLIKEVMTNMQFDMPGVVKTDEQLAQEEQKAQEYQQAQVMSQYAGPAAQVINKAMEQGASANNNQQPTGV